MPDKPTAKLTVGAVMNDEEEKMLSGIADVDVVRSVNICTASKTFYRSPVVLFIAELPP